MRLVFFGSGAFGVPTLRRLIDEHEVVLIVTQPDRPAGRRRQLTLTPVAETAAQSGIPVLKPEIVNDSAAIDQIQSQKADAWVVIAFGQKMGAALLQGQWAINLHASLLPKYRGAAPINWAMMNGETETGLSVITVAERMDAGDVLGQMGTSIDPRETAGEMHDRLSLMGPALIIDVLKRHQAGTLEARRQEESQATKAPKLAKTDGTVCFAQSANGVRCRVHGLTPWPGCWIMLGERSLRLHRVEIVQSNHPQTTPGTLLPDLTVACVSFGQSVRLLEVQPANGKLMSFDAYSRGHGVRAGERCVPL